MGYDNVSLHRSSFGTVSVTNYKQGLRLRWSADGKRPEIYIPPTVQRAKEKALKIKQLIERDIISNNYDGTLQRYRAILKNAVLEDLLHDQQTAKVSISGNIEVKQVERFDIHQEFKRYLAIKGHSKEIPNYFYHTKKMIEGWGDFDIEDVPVLLSNMGYSNNTFNTRRNCLSSFFQWCVRKKKLLENPLEDVKTKRTGQNNDRRKPFTDQEAKAILEALKNDTFSNSHSYPHSQYHDIVAFLLHVGARNAEGIGLLVKDCDFETFEVCIGRSFARTRAGSNIGARKMKGTKNENQRFIPMDQYLYDLLFPLCKGKQPGDFVFLNKNGNPIDDRMFQKRIFKPLLVKLGIEERDLYCCRHTFATRSIRHGLKPHEVAYLLGDSVQTVLKNYFHNNLKPTSLPSPVTELKEEPRRHIITLKNAV